uniref:Uncharacterized protein n=1 Tax=Kalanchoe fedtschenkoi TaxID=63787 RepID=A0A7N0VDZ6_KALFE
MIDTMNPTRGVLANDELELEHLVNLTQCRFFAFAASHCCKLFLLITFLSSKLTLILL